MRRFPRFALMIVTALIVLAPAAARAGWSVGTDVGLSFFLPDEGDGITSIGWGGSEGLLIPIFQPGLRVGFTLGQPQHEIMTTSNVQILATEGETFRVFQAMVAYQHNFGGEVATRPFVNGGIGLNLVGDESDTFSAPAFGAGVGLRRMLGHGHGAIRFEGRFDHQNEFEESGVIVFPSANVIALRVGWELMN